MKRVLIGFLVGLVAFALVVHWRNCPSASEREAIEAWLACDECTSGELERVVRLENCAVSVLAQRIQAPGAVPREVMRRRIEAQYVLSDSGLPRARHTALLLENHVALTQKRAAIALAAIGTRKARAALRMAHDSAEAWAYRADVVRVLDSELDRARFTRFTGTLSDSSVTFGERIVVRPGSTAWDGDEWATITGTPLGDSLVVSQSTDSLVLLAIAERGSYTVRIVRQGPDQITEIAPLRVTSLRYNVHPPAPPPDVTSAGFPQRRYLALGVRPSDTSDHFRFTPASNLAVTATAVLAGGDPPTLTWHRCPLLGLASLGDPSRLSGVVLNETGTGVPSVRVTIPGTALAAITSTSGMFSLTGIPSAATAGGVISLELRKQPSRSRTIRVQAGATAVQVSYIADSAATRATLTRHGSSVTIPRDSCQVLRLTVAGGQQPQLVRLDLTSP